jgi:hypothetical protein
VKDANKVKTSHQCNDQHQQSPPHDPSPGDRHANTESDSPPRAAPILHEAANGERFTIDDLQDLPPQEQEIVRQSDDAFIAVRRTWPNWQRVGAGLAILRGLAMREIGCNNVLSKRYRDRFHQLLAHRSYRSMEPTTRKALLQCDEHASEIDEWLASLDEGRRLRLNHPVAVLRAFRASQNPRPPRSRQSRNETELATVRQEAVAALARKDAEIKELTKRRTDAPTGGANTGMHSGAEQTVTTGAADTDSIVAYVIAKCGSSEKIRKVISGLEAYLEQGP